MSLGEEVTHYGVNRIVARGGKGSDSIYVGEGVKAVLDFDGGDGKDNFNIFGGAAGSVIRGGAGRDVFQGGSVAGIRYEGGDGDDRFVGGGAAEIVDMGAGSDTVFGGGGNDTIYIGTGESVVDTGEGDNLLLVSGGGRLEVTGGSGTDRLVLSPISTTADQPIRLNDHQFVQGARTIDFTDALDRIEVRDNAAATKIVTGSGASWGATDLALDAAGVLDVTGATFHAPQALLSLQAQGIRGTINTTVAELAVVNTLTGGVAAERDIVVREADDLDIVTDNRTNGGLYAAGGRIDVELAKRESLLTLRSGVLSTAASGGAISIVADDVDFFSGDDRVRGTGTLTLRAKDAAQDYRIGAAGQSTFGRDLSRNGATGTFDLGMGDLSALADGFSAITIGHRAPGVLMSVGDVENKAVGIFNFLSRFTDPATLQADRIDVMGDLQSTDTLTLSSRLLEVQRQNVQDPLGPADSGITARRALVNVTEQIQISGWIKGDELVDIDVTGSTGVDAMFTSQGGPISLSADKGSSVQSLNAGSRVEITTSHAILSATTIEARGADSVMKVIAGTGLTVLEGAAIVARSDRARIELSATDYIHLNSGSAVTSGARFDMVGATPVPVKTGADATLSIITTGELNIAGSVTAAGTLTIQSGQTRSTYADYFDTLPGRTISTLGAADLQAALLGLKTGTLSPALSTLLSSSAVGLQANPALTSLQDYAPFTSLSKEARDALALRLGYTSYVDGGYYNATTGAFRTSLTQGAAVSASGYERQDGLVFYKANAAEAQPLRALLAQETDPAKRQALLNQIKAIELRTGFLQGERPDYSNTAINWQAAGVPAPAANATFESLTSAQKMVVASSLGYVFDHAVIPLDTWASAPFDYAQIPLQTWIDASTIDFRNTLSTSQWGSVPRPQSGTPYASLTEAQRAVVDRWVEFSPMQVDRLVLTGEYTAGATLAVTINGTRVAVTVQASDIGANQAATRSAVALRLANAINAQPVVASKVTAESSGDVLRVRSKLSSEAFTLTLDANDARVEQTRVAQLAYADLTPGQRDVVMGKLRPSLEARWEDLTAAQRNVITAYLGGPDDTGLIDHDGDSSTPVRTIPLPKNFFNFNAAPGDVTRTTFSQGPLTDYENANVFWGSVPAPSAGASFGELTLAQKKVVAKALGYEVYESGVWYRADALAATRLVTQAATGAPADFSLELIDWGGVRAPAKLSTGAERGFDDLTLAQQRVVAQTLGYDVLDRQVFVKLNAADAAKRVLTLLVEGADYQNGSLN
ncbi:calcium-binding protein [Gemmatimonas sp.]|uniref:calcium-binding protein n=1 Tax=Gemmatimonas sp. TaxID=1962908 RepID=UPI0025BF0E0C|nr:calcium-binding protein [Gemmatimonas sp.]MCA2996678.1 hypothetical protein [Gemmatimonas sp.]